MTQKFYTFGPDHKHPDSGKSLGGQYVVVNVPGSLNDGCRARMFRYFGNNWASEYSELPLTIMRAHVAEWPREQYDRSKLGPEICLWMDENDPDMAPAQP